MVLRSLFGHGAYGHATFWILPSLERYQTKPPQQDPIEVQKIEKSHPVTALLSLLHHQRQYDAEEAKPKPPWGLPLEPIVDSAHGPIYSTIHRGL